MGASDRALKVLLPWNQSRAMQPPSAHVSSCLWYLALQVRLRRAAGQHRQLDPSSSGNVKRPTSRRGSYGYSSLNNPERT